MYKILIKYPNEKFPNLWEAYGTITTSSIDSETSFTEFKTDDMEILKTEIAKLDSKYGHDSIRIIKDVSYEVQIAVSDTSNNTPDIPVIDETTVDGEV